MSSLVLKDAYYYQQLRKNHVWGCPYCSKEHPEDKADCCGETHNEWLLVCDSCEEIIPDSAEAYERDRGRYYVCKACHETGDV